MKIEAPCRIGERFSYDGDVTGKRGRFVLTGLDFFAWSTPGQSGVTLCAKKEPENKQENTRFYQPEDPAEGIRITFELPDDLFVPGYPLRELGMETDAMGYLQGVALTEDGWEFHVYYGKSYGGTRVGVRTETLDRLFAPVLLPRAVDLDLRNFLI